MRISDWSSDVCSSDLRRLKGEERLRLHRLQRRDALEAGEEDRGNRLVAMDVHRPVDAAFIHRIPHAQHLGAALRRRIVPFAVEEIGRASCRERVCQYVLISVVAVALKKKKKTK